jgi:hypothetical protein
MQNWRGHALSSGSDAGKERVSPNGRCDSSRSSWCNRCSCRGGRLVERLSRAGRSSRRNCRLSRGSTENIWVCITQCHPGRKAEDAPSHFPHQLLKVLRPFSGRPSCDCVLDTVMEAGDLFICLHVEMCGICGCNKAFLTRGVRLWTEKRKKKLTAAWM